jgi:hypothetical protein
MVRELREGSPAKVEREEGIGPTADSFLHDSVDSSNVTALRSRRNGLLARVAFLAAAGYAFSAGLRVEDAAGVWDPALTLGLLLYVGGLVSLLFACMAGEPTGRFHQVFLAALVLVALVGSVAYEISTSVRSYGTDSIALSHVAGEVLIRGENPYSITGESLAPVFERFGIADTIVTQTLSGGTIERLVSYPAGHLVTHAGALALGLEDMRWVTLAFEVGALALIWWAVSPPARFLVPLALLVEPNLTVHFTSGGVTDWMWVLPLVVTAVMLHRRQWGYAGLALGVACAMKQQPWFVVPFVLIWAFLELRRSNGTDVVKRDFGALVFGVLAGFAVLNLPFVVWDPADWLRGSLSPLLDDLVPDGQGPSLLASRGFLPLPQVAFSIAMAVVFGVAVYLYYRRFDRMRNLLWVLPAVVLFFSHRSLHNYFIFWIPAAALWLDLEMTPNRYERMVESPVDEHPPRLLPAVLTGAAILAAGAIGWFQASGDTIQVGSVRPLINDGILSAIEVEITNTGEDLLEPVFGIYWGRYTVPWEASNRTSIEPGQRSTVRIVPSEGGELPPLIAADGGALRVSPFRVRVSDVGHSEFASSALVEPEPFQAFLINPRFRYWDTPIGVLDESPYGWIGTRLEPAGSTVKIEALDGGGGLALGVRRERARADGWAEAAAVQEVMAVASCYSLDITYSGSYDSDSQGRPLAVSGLQVLQPHGAVWLVPSDIAQTRSTDLPEGTRIVEVPAAPGRRQTLTLDLAGIGRGTGVELGEPGTLKLFSGLNENQTGKVVFRVHSIGLCDQARN